MSQFDLARVRQYYEVNTASFVAYGQGGGEGAIHRAVWGPGVVDRREAFHYVEDRIASVVAGVAESSEVAHVVDLGCGVGGSLCYLAAKLPMRGTGVTLSPTQASLARERLRALGLDDRLAILEADFCQLPNEVPRADVAYAIESFVHATDAARFLTQCAELIRPGGALIICDDLLRELPEVERKAAAQEIDRFRRGWHVNTLLSRERLQLVASNAGFVHESTTDLTPWLELGRLRDRALEVLIAPLGWLGWESARTAPLAGGTALQRCLTRGWLGYDLVVFRRAG